MAGKAKSITGLTSMDGAPQVHGHSYEIDEYGNGQTGETVGNGPPHTHMIVGKKLRPSGFDNHVHRLVSGRPGTDDSDG